MKVIELTRDARRLEASAFIEARRIRAHMICRFARAKRYGKAAE